MFSQAIFDASAVLRLAALRTQQRAPVRPPMTLPVTLQMIHVTVPHTMGVHAHQPRA